MPDLNFVIVRTSKILCTQVNKHLLINLWVHFYISSYSSHCHFDGISDQGPFFWSKSHSLNFFFSYPMNQSLTNLIWLGMSLFSTFRWCCTYIFVPSKDILCVHPCIVFSLFNHSLLQVLLLVRLFLLYD